MYYCFLLEDKIANNDPLYIQGEYARQLECYCIASLEKHTVFDSMLRPINLTGQKVFLRTTCENVTPGLKLLEQLGAVPIETEQDIAKIEEWCTLNLTQRQIKEIDLSDIMQIDSITSADKGRKAEGGRRNWRRQKGDAVISA